MRSRIPTLFISCLVLTGICASCFRSRTLREEIADELRIQLLSSQKSGDLKVHEEVILAKKALENFYHHRSYQPVWSTEDGLLPQADSLVQVILQATREGLVPEDYHLASLQDLIRDFRDNQQGSEFPVASRLSDLDVLLTDAFFVYALHRREGKVDPGTREAVWSPHPDSTLYGEILERAVSSDRVAESLGSLLPRHPYYVGLRKLLAFYEALQTRGGWALIPGEPPLTFGERGKRIALLRKHLAMTRDLRGGGWKESDGFDSSLVRAVRMFQMHHGLEATGVVDSSTLVALNIPIRQRIEQIKVNMERWRWLPREMGTRHIRVNVADFRLTVIEGRREVMSMKVVVGNKDWQTPVFSSLMTQVLFNDYWLAPHHILESELINYMKADSNYLPRNKMVLLRGSGDSVREVDPRSVNIANLDPKDIDFALRQDPGPENIMGQVKFLFPNEYDVFLHDTPYREDFGKNVRMYSHGCIRLEKPFNFAEYVLRDMPGWDRAKIDSVVARIERESIVLKNPIPVLVLYSTVWVDEDGIPQFREDVYGRDNQISVAVNGRAQRMIVSQ